MAELKHERKSWVTEGLILASIPLLAYILVFSYEYGFASIFGIPLTFISLDLTNVFVVLASIVGIFGLLFHLVNWVYSLISPLPSQVRYSPLGKSLTRLGLSTLVLIGPLCLHRGRWKEWIIFAIVPIMIACLEFIFPLFSQRGKGNYLEKLKAQEEIEESYSTIYDLLGDKGLLITGLLLIALTTSFTAGRASAYDGERYLIANTSPKTVILRIYGENMICSPFDEKTKEVEKKFKVLRIGNDPNLTLSLEKIGPLISK